MTTFSAPPLYTDNIAPRIHVGSLLVPTTVTTGIHQYLFLTPKPNTTGQLWPRPRLSN